MIRIRKSKDRGHINHGWLDTYHTFAFASYTDRRHVHFRTLRVINEDFIAAGEGFGTHPHEDMEIITYVLDGAIAHKDSMGNGSTILPGDVQYMSAGTGVLHSEFNGRKDVTTHLMQIWIFPDRKGLKPRYDQRSIPEVEKLNALRLIAREDESPEDTQPSALSQSDGAIRIRQDARLYASILESGKSVVHPLAQGRGTWIQVLRGELDVNGTALKTGDGAAIEDETQLTITGAAGARAEFLLFDLS